VEKDAETTIDEIMEIVQGPDFPTGAMILGRSGIEEAYRTGRGKIYVRAVTDIETLPSGRSRIVITELPYLVNKARLIEKMAELVKTKKIDGITGITDESSREGLRVTVDVRHDANANVILNQLFKHTQLQDTFGVNMLALVGTQPKIMNLLEMLQYYLKHQEDVVTRRTKYELNKALERAHILEGLLIALDNIDEVIQIIRSSQTTQLAKEGLMKRFSLSDAQAQAIVDMRLRALTGLERSKLQEEYAQLQKQITRLREILADEKVLLGVIRTELLAISEKYADERRTKIGLDVYDLSTEDLIPRGDVVITMTKNGYIKRMSEDTFRSQNRGGKGIKGMQTLENDHVSDMIMVSSHDYLMFFTNKGRVYRLKAYEIPESGRTSRGTAVINLLELQNGEKVTSVIRTGSFDSESYVFMATRSGMVKKTPMQDYANVRKKGLTAIVLKEDDELIDVKFTDSTKQVLLITKNGQCIRFRETDVRSTGRASMGVIGIHLTDGDEVVAMVLSDEGDQLLTVSEKGYGKRTDLREFSAQGRGGKGIRCYRILEKQDM
jgi:DNA gyrase subunit A